MPFRKIYFLVFILFAACRPSDIIPENIKVTVLEPGNIVEVDWSRINFDQSEYKFDIYLEGKLIIAGFQGNKYTFRDLEFDKAYTGTVQIKRNFRPTEIENFSFRTGKETVSIPDAGFEKALIDGGWDTDGVINKKMFKSDAPLVRSILASNYAIKSVEGIQFMTNLLSLNLNKNQISSLNLSQNTKITFLDISENGLNVFDSSPLTNLITYIAFSNNFNAVNLNLNTKIETLKLSGNNLSTINLSFLSALKNLSLGKNQLTTLNLSSNTNLEAIDISDNKLTALGTIQLFKLVNLSAQNNLISSLTLPALIEYLDVSNNKLSQILANRSSTSFLNLQIVDVSQNLLTSLNVKGLNKITALNTKLNAGLKNICVDNINAANMNLLWIKDQSTNFINNCP